VIRDGAHTSDDALRMAFDLHYSALIRLCLALGDQPGDAEDTVQEAFVRAAPSIDRLDAAVVRSYLRRAVVNIRHDRRRRSTRLGDVPEHDVPITRLPLTNVTSCGVPWASFQTANVLAWSFASMRT
jgi:DNA-directed RNA polymerase specialized sigma24 family protein